MSSENQCPIYQFDGIILDWIIGPKLRIVDTTMNSIMVTTWLTGSIEFEKNQPNHDPLPRQTSKKIQEQRRRSKATFLKTGSKNKKIRTGRENDEQERKFGRESDRNISESTTTGQLRRTLHSHKPPSTPSLSRRI